MSAIVGWLTTIMSCSPFDSNTQIMVGLPIMLRSQGLATETLFHYGSPESPHTAARKEGGVVSDAELRAALSEASGENFQSAGFENTFCWRNCETSNSPLAAA